MTTQGRRQLSNHLFYIGTALAALLLVGAGFGPALMDQASRRRPISLLVISHGVVTCGWLTVYLAQTLFIATGRTRLHRRLGAIGVGLAVLVVVLGYETTIVMARRGFDLSGDLFHRTPVPVPTLLGNMLFPLAELAEYTVLVGAALIYRDRANVHKRFMVLATVILMSEPLAHLFGHYSIRFRFFGPTLSILLLSSAIHDRVALGRMHPVSLWGGASLSVLSLVFATVVRPSTAWQHFAAWLAA